MMSRFCAALVVTGLVAGIASAYSVLTHETIIDTSWKDNIRPLLLKRFPNSTEDELRKAHGFAYGGAIVQDMGYYPFGSHFFSDLTHYVRSGDFVLTLLSEAQDLNEYAFALGSLAHYAADCAGHFIATNRAVPIMFPKVRKKFGPRVTYADDPVSHVRAEFSFDVVQVANGHYAPDAYHDFIGFDVAQSLLNRAFEKTYSIEAKSIVLNEELAIGTYRYTVSTLLPEMTRVAWQLKKDEIVKAEPSATRRKFIYNLSRASYRKEWGARYKKPGIGTRIITFIIRIIPKVGPLRAFAFKPPGPDVEKLFMESVNKALDRYRALLQEHGRGTLRLPNENFDTGEPTKPGAYALADQTYAKLLDRLDGKPISPDLRADILAFYQDLDAPFTNKKSKSWPKLVAKVEKLKAGAPSPAPSAAAKD